MTSCSATRKDGTPCVAKALEGETLCWAHSPRMTEQRRAVRAAGGRGRGKLSRSLAALPPELADLFGELRELFAEVRAGETKARDAEVAGGLAGRLLDYAKFAAETSEAREIERRLNDLEERLGDRQRRAY